jgi:hypothetical protein
MSLDLVIVVADKDIEQAVLGLLTRAPSLGIRPALAMKVLVHPQRDPGVFKSGHDLIATFSDTASHALLILDHAWSGAPATPVEAETSVEERCAPAWRDRARCVCIEPEVEAWVWSDSPHVASALGWSSLTELRTWLEREGLWGPAEHKPRDPKAAFQRATRERGRVPSSAIFNKLASSVGLARCTDRAFLRLRETLTTWFPSQR